MAALMSDGHATMQSVEGKKVRPQTRPTPVKKGKWDGWEKSKHPCQECGGVVYMQEINDYPDTAIKCAACKMYYIVDGPDS